MSDPLKVVTGKVRLSYANLFEARPPKNAPDAEPKFSVTLLIPKSDADTVKRIKSAQEAAIVARWGDKRPAKIATTLHDGDGVKEVSGEPYGDECKGHWVMSVSSKQQPGVVDAQLNPIIDRSEIYSGCYARVSIRAYSYDVSGKRGVSFGLNNVQKVADGESLGGSSSRAQDDFTAIEDELLA